MEVYCEPRIRHGEASDRYRPNEDGTDFVKTEEMPLEKFPKVGIGALLGPGEPGDLAVPAAGRERTLDARRPSRDRWTVPAEALGFRASPNNAPDAPVTRDEKRVDK